MRQQPEYAQLQQLQAQQTAAAQQVAFFPQPPAEPQQQQPVVPQPTAFGSNNPFVSHSAASPTSPALPPRSTSLPSRDGPVAFNLPDTYDGREPKRHGRAQTEDERREREGERDSAFLRPFSTGTEPPRRRSGGEREDARLASLFANYTGDGVDTFGNVGQLR